MQARDQPGVELTTRTNTDESTDLRATTYDNFIAIVQRDIVPTIDRQHGVVPTSNTNRHHRILVEYHGRYPTEVGGDTHQDEGL